MYRSLSTSIGILLALSLSIMPVFGQQSHTVDSISLPSTISANELDATAQLYTQIETIYAVYETKLIEAETEAEKAAIKNIREAAIETTIRDASLSAERYRTILHQTDQDDNLAERLQRRIQKARTK